VYEKIICVDFVIKFIHGIRAWALSYSEQYGGLLEVDGVIFVLGLRVKWLSVSSLEDVGYSTFFKRGHVFIYMEGVDPVEP
jgi:hypothetical protein